MPGWGGGSAHGGDATTGEVADAAEPTDAAHAAAGDELTMQTSQEARTPTAEEPIPPIRDDEQTGA